MPVMIVKHKVADFKQWKVVFDSMGEVRRKHGWKAHEVYQGAGDPNFVTVVNHMRDLEGAKAYGTSQELKSAMAKAGVQGAPEIVFMEDAEQKLY